MESWLFLVATLANDFSLRLACRVGVAGQAATGLFIPLPPSVSTAFNSLCQRAQQRDEKTTFGPRAKSGAGCVAAWREREKRR